MERIRTRRRKEQGKMIPRKVLDMQSSRAQPESMPEGSRKEWIRARRSEE